MPRAIPPSTKRRRISEAAYKALLDILKHGRSVTDPRTGQQARDENGKPIFTPATAADIGQARQMARELADAARAEESNPYAQLAKQNVTLRDQLCALGYSDREARAIIERKKARYDEPD